jgi:hypothetical protein
MLVQNCYSYIKIGLAIRLLRNVAKTETKEFVNSALDTLIQELKTANFQVTLASMNSEYFASMQDDLTALTSNTEEIGEALAAKVRHELTLIETVVFPESSIKKIYVLPSRRFNSDYLLYEPGKLLKDGVFLKLDEIARHDITSACKCLLFGEATAAAFHILRATESVLKSYYCHHKKQNRLEKPMWANMVDQLRAKTKNKPPEILLNSLDLIRTAYRNPTQHPQATYEIDSAQDLFGVCLDAIGKMGTELPVQ